MRVEANNHHASCEPQDAEERQPPDLERHLRREGAITGATNENPKHRMSF